MPKSIEYMQDNNLSEKHAKCLNWKKLLRPPNTDNKGKLFVTLFAFVPAPMTDL